MEQENVEIRDVDGNEDVPCGCFGVNARCVETGTKNYVLQHQQFVCGRMPVIEIASPGDNSCPIFLFLSL